uniref:Tetraspanin-8-like n=1 Tax=Stegastes partitus TaxID=144197 RepID=A0A3B5AIE3_9TELE
MGKVNVCLKRSYFIVVGLIAIIAILLLGLTLFSHGHFHQEDEIEKVLTTLHAMYAIAVIILVLAFTGAFGAYKEKKWALIVFTVGMIMTTLFMTACNIAGLVSKPHLEKGIQKTYLSLLPLANRSDSVTESLMEIQGEFQCCGLDKGYQDWNNHIPESCLCVEDSVNPCPCIPFIVETAVGALNAVLGILLGVTLLWVLSVVLCVVILCRLDRKDEIPAVVYSSEAKAGNYTTLTEEYT